MRESHLKAAIVVCVIAILALVVANYVDLGKEDKNHVRVNEGIISSADFDVVCDELGSGARGAAFAFREGDSIRIRIVADVTVGEEDLGGIIFRFGSPMRITDVACDFNGDAGPGHVQAWNYNLKPSANREVYVGSGMAPIRPTYGTYIPDPGHGAVAIDVVLEGKAASEADSLKFTVIVGGKIHEAGYAVMGVVYETVAMPLTGKASSQSYSGG